MDTIELLGRVLVSLAAVLGVMWVIARRVRGSKGARATKLIDVLGRQSLSRNASVAVVRVGDKALVVGVTDNQVSVLSETDLAAAQALVGDGEPGGRSRSRHGGSTRTRTRATVPTRTIPAPAPAAAPAAAAPAPEPARAGALAGSALSPATWKQTIESLRDLTARTD
ncbi:MAG TPA: flagellar biosynthetic protein FliO [Jatrophihabitans sp.]|jgi:flagellar protein FliO/FliZ|nr:flagellar biosynthetic protein FliO [Jatrophihabitans sp.]